jgi:hypothetical protein
MFTIIALNTYINNVNNTSNNVTGIKLKYRSTLKGSKNTILIYRQEQIYNKIWKQLSTAQIHVSAAACVCLQQHEISLVILFLLDPVLPVDSAFTSDILRGPI